MEIFTATIALKQLWVKFNSWTNYQNPTEYIPMTRNEEKITWLSIISKSLIISSKNDCFEEACMGVSDLFSKHYVGFLYLNFFGYFQDKIFFSGVWQGILL